LLQTIRVTFSGEDVAPTDGGEENVSDPAVLRVLVIEDDADTRSNLRDILELDGYEVATAASAAEGLSRADWLLLSAIILDRKLPDGTAEELLPRLRALAPDAGVIVVTGYADVEGAIAALRQGAADYILKPINPDVLRARLAQFEERYRLTAAKRRSEAAFRTLVEAAPCLIVILRTDHTVLYFSRFAEEMTGYTADEVLGENYLDLLSPKEQHQAVADELHQAAGHRPSRGYESPVICKDGSWRWLVWNAQPLHDYEGAPALLCVGQDITTLKEAQERALQAERLAAIGQMVTGLAHESGNALARSQACLEMLALEVDDRPEAVDLIARVQKAQDHLRQLYDEVRGYASPLKLQREQWDLGSVWRQAWNNLAVARQGRNAVLKERHHGVDLHCAIDPFRLEQVFRNIFENALAACRDPAVIEVHCAPARLHDAPAVRIAVRDNGPGLSAEQQKRIFDPFFTTKTKGTGLGMAIAKRIIEAHQGQIAVGSTGPGAEILLILPREKMP
jgi:PAS domain S-box-containing protein